MRNRILITGGNGYIGSHLVNLYLRKGCEVDVIDIINSNLHKSSNNYYCNIESFNELSKIKNNYDVIVHCAGSPSVPLSVENPVKDFSINLKGTLNMLEFSKANNSMFILLSTVSVFDTSNKLPLDESSSKKPTSPYGASKLASEAYCQAYFRSYGLDTRIARIFNTYGPGMNHLFVSDMIKKIDNSKNEVLIGGSGNQIRDYIFIEDLAEAVFIISTNGIPGEDYNICSGSKYTLLDITKNLVKIMDRKDLEIKCDGMTYKGDIEKWYGNPKKIQKIGFNQNHSLEQGLKKTLYK